MKAEELMIGDFLRFRQDYPFKHLQSKIVMVRGIRGRVDARTIDDGKCYESEHPDWLEPIPLTPEILEKNGFVKIRSTVISTWNCSVDRMYSMSIDINRETGDMSGHFHSDVNRVRLFCPVNHAHQLQHALRLCGIEKEIVL